MASSPSLWELPVGVAADGVAVPVQHPPRCSVCQFTGYNHPIFKGVYNCLCEVNSDLKVLFGDSRFSFYVDWAKSQLSEAGFPIGESVPMVMACEISPQLSGYKVKDIRRCILKMKVGAMISMRFDFNKIPPDWCSSDLYWYGRINASGDLSLEREVQKIDTPGLYYRKFHFRLWAQMLDDPEQYEPVGLNIQAENFEIKKNFKAPEFNIAPRTFSSSKIYAGCHPPQRVPVILGRPAEILGQSNFKKISTGGSKLYEELGRQRTARAPLLVPVHCYEQTFTSFGGGNAQTHEYVIKISGKVISSFQSVAAQAHVIDFYEQMPETKKIIPGIRFSNEATDPPAKLNEIVIGITGQAAFSIMGYALTGSSSSPASYFVVGATAIGFICTFIALTLKGTKKPAARILGKVGAMAAACAVIVAMGMFLPANTIWTTGIACLIAVVAVALA